MDVTDSHGNAEYQCKSMQSMGIYVPRTSTEGHGNAEDGINDNGDNVAPKSIPLGRSGEMV